MLRRLAGHVLVVIVAVLTGCSAGTNTPAPVAAVKPKAAKAPLGRELGAERQAAVAIEKQLPAAEAAAAKSVEAAAPQAASPANNPPEKIAENDPAGPKAQTAFYRADSGPAEIPRVLLSKGDEALCKVKVGDAMPAIALPKIGGTSETKLADLFGKKATVVVFWKSDRRMAREQLADLGPDVLQPFGERGVAIVGIAVNESAKSALETARNAGAAYPNLLDADGKAFAQVGSGKLPRTYLLDPSGKILWFDIEYSLATRRELHQALRAVAGEPASGDAGAKQE